MRDRCRCGRNGRREDRYIRGANGKLAEERITLVKLAVSAIGRLR
ncbi:MAG: hypothetical protein ACREQJ_05245 [Candidatus Binatia bacterium]